MRRLAFVFGATSACALRRRKAFQNFSNHVRSFACICTYGNRGLYKAACQRREFTYA